MPALPTYLMHALKQTSRVCLLHALMSCIYINFYLLVPLQYFDGLVQCESLSFKSVVHGFFSLLSRLTSIHRG